MQAVLYNGDEALTLAEDGTYHIVNYTQDEIVSRSVESNKIVSLLNWNQRTYRIDLTASSTTTQTIKTPYDIVLVLDQSSSMSNSFVEYVKFTGSMNDYPDKTYYIKTRNGIYQQLERARAGGWWPNYNYTWSYKDSYTGNTVTVDQNTTDVYVKSTSSKTKMQALKDAATQFVNNVDQKNSDCRVGIVTFADEGAIKSITRNNYTLAKVGTSKEAINNTIKNLSPSEIPSQPRVWIKQVKCFLIIKTGKR